MAPLPGALEVLLQGFGYTMLTAFLSAVLRTIVILFYFIFFILPHCWNNLTLLHFKMIEISSHGTCW